MADAEIDPSEYLHPTGYQGTPTPKPVQWLSTRNAAKLLDISSRQLVGKVLRGVIKASRVGPRKGRLYFDEVEIRRYQDSHPVVGRKEPLE